MARAKTALISLMGDRKSTRLNSSHTVISYAVFFFKYTATTEIYTLSLHDALPIWPGSDLLSRVLRRTTIGAGKFNGRVRDGRSEEHTSELQSHSDLVCRLLF